MTTRRDADAGQPARSRSAEPTLATAPEAAQSARVPAKLIATNIRMVTTWYIPASGVASRSNAYV